MTVDFDALVLAPSAACFGVPVTYIPGWAGTPVTLGTDGAPLTGIYDDKHLELSFKDGDEVSTRHPVLSIRQSMLPGGLPPAQGEVFVVNGTNYVVTNISPDGFGDLKLNLRLATD